MLATLRIPIFFIALLTTSLSVLGQSFQEVLRTLPQQEYTDTLPNAYMGFSVALSDSIAAIGAHNFNKGRGVVFIAELNKEGWYVTDTLLGSTALSGAEFGNSLAMDGDLLIIGSRRDSEHDVQTGAAYIFQLENGKYEEKQKIFPPSPVPYSNFGWSVAVKNATLYVGAPGYEHNEIEGGAAFGYAYNSGTVNLIDVQHTEPAEILTDFGIRLQITETYLFVSAEEMNFGERGAVYFYKRDADTTVLLQKLFPELGNASYSFGHAISFSPPYLAVGAPYSNGANKGGAFLYRMEEEQFNLQSTFALTDPADNDYFATALAMEGNTILVGARGRVREDGGLGQAYLFEVENDSAVLRATIAGLGTGEDEQLGLRVAMKDSTLLIGATNFDGPGPSSGCAYFYTDQQDTAELISHVIPPAINTSLGSQFGKAVAIGHHLAAVGAPSFNDGVGYVYLYKRTESQWFLEDSIPSPTGKSKRNFGAAISISGDHILIGAPGNESGTPENSGEAYLYKYSEDTVELITQIVPAANTLGSLFGKSVGMKDSTLFIGAPKGNLDGNLSGGVYLFEFSNGVVQEKYSFYSETGVNYNEQFGWDFDFNSDKIIVGARHSNSSGYHSGVAYAYQFSHDSATFIGEIEPKNGPFTSDLDGNYEFGTSISISGSKLVIGAPCTNTNNNLPGKAYLFHLDTLDNENYFSLTPQNQERLNGFGTDVSISHQSILVGNPCSSNSELEGQVYLFECFGDTALETGVFEASNGNGFNGFGYAVSLAGSTFISGAPSSNTNGAQTGEAYVFDKLCAPNRDVDWPSKKLCHGDTLQATIFHPASGFEYGIFNEQHQPVSPIYLGSTVPQLTIKANEPNLPSGNYQVVTWDPQDPSCERIIGLVTQIQSTVFDTTIIVHGDSIIATKGYDDYIWFDCNSGDFLSGESSNVLVADPEGSYSVSLVHNGCTYESECFTPQDNGLATVHSKPDVIVYPNPTNDQCIVEVPGSQQIKSIKLMNQLGIAVLSLETPATRSVLNVSQFPTGLYTIVVETGSGKFYRKILKY